MLRLVCLVITDDVKMWWEQKVTHEVLITFWWFLWLINKPNNINMEYICTTKTLNVVDFTVISTHVLQKIIFRTNRNAPKNSADHIQNNCASFNQVGTRWFVEEMKNCGKWKENWVLLKTYLSLLPLETATNKNWEIFEGVIVLLYFKIWKSSGKKHHCAWYFW